MKTLGGIDAQSMESTHPAWNTLMRRFGNSRSCHFNGQVMRQFCMELEVIDDMPEATYRTKRVDTNKRGSGRADLDRIVNCRYCG